MRSVDLRRGRMRRREAVKRAETEVMVTLARMMMEVRERNGEGGGVLYARWGAMAV